VVKWRAGGEEGARLGQVRGRKKKKKKNKDPKGTGGGGGGAAKGGESTSTKVSRFLIRVQVKFQETPNTKNARTMYCQMQRGGLQTHCSNPSRPRDRVQKVSEKQIVVV